MPDAKFTVNLGSMKLSHDERQAIARTIQSAVLEFLAENHQGSRRFVALLDDPVEDPPINAGMFAAPTAAELEKMTKGTK